RVADVVPQTNVSIQKNPDKNQWLYVPSWKRLLPKAIGSDETASRMKEAKTWLVYADDCGFAEVLIARLKSAGQDVITARPGSEFRKVDPRTFTIEPANSQHYDSLIRALQSNQSLPDRIIHAWSFAKTLPAQPDCDAFTQAQARGFYSLVLLAKTFAAHNVGHEIRLFVLTKNVQEVCGSEVLAAEQSTVLGPCMVIPQEYPNIRVKNIDVDLLENGSGHESAADLVMGEILDSDSRLFVVHRKAQRWVQTYEPVETSNTGESGWTFREGGVYLITGGLGRIGVAISEFLAEKYRASLV